MDRRSYLAAATAAGSSLLAGCSFFAAASAPEPEVPADRLRQNGWERTDQTEQTVFERAYAGVTVTAVSNTVQYADAALAADVEEKSLGEVTTSLNTFFASRIDVSPALDDLPAGVGEAEIVSRVDSRARTRFETQLADRGLVSIAATGERDFSVETGGTADLVEYTAAFPVDEISFRVTDGESVALDATRIEVAGYLATWDSGDYLIVAGGAHPTENYAQSVEESLSDAVTVSVNVDLGLTPDEYRSEILGYVRAVG